MHTRLCDLARTANCYRDAPQPDARRVSALVWLVALVAFGVIVGLAVMA
jgi:hypothetical protein